MSLRFAAPALTAFALAGAVATAAPAQTPAAAASALYAWVFHGHDANRDLHAIRPVLSARFYGDLTRVFAVEARTHTLVLDANPFIDAQIEADYATVGTPSVTGSTATVPVKISYKRYPKGNVLTMVEVKTASGWRIDDILDHTGHSTDALIRRNLAMSAKYAGQHARRQP